MNTLTSLIVLSLLALINSLTKGVSGAMLPKDAWLQTSFWASENASYTLSLKYRTLGGSKRQKLIINGLESGTILFGESKSFSEQVIATATLRKGNNDIVFVGYEGFVEIESMNVYKASIQPFAQPLNTGVKAQCGNEVCKKRNKLLNYFAAKYGKFMISGQQEKRDSDAIRNIAGDYPVMLGLDFIHYRQDRQEGYGATEEGIEWIYQGGIVEWCWHWKSPTDEAGPDSFYSEQSRFDLNYALANTGSWQYQRIIQDIDIVIKQLRKLQDRGLVVLFRPLHEAQGGWFWWGKFGPQNYVKLYRLVVDRIRNAGLENIVWVYNSMGYGSAANAWNPGRSYYDIISTDIYFNKGDNRKGDGNGLFNNLVQESGGNALVALAENGEIPDVDACFNGVKKQAPWLFFKTWFGMLQDSSINSLELVKYTFQHPKVLLREEFKEDYKKFWCQNCA